MEKSADKFITIAGRPVGDNQPAFIIAEAGINHNGKIELAKKLVDVAVKAGADAVKFQMRSFDSLYAKGAIANMKNEDIGTQYIFSLIKDSELTKKQFKELFNYCKEKNIIFLCTPWDLHSVDVLEEVGVSAYKIASADLVNFELLEYVASKKKPMIISTGMSTLEEIKNSVEFLERLKAEFVILHCNSAYPSAPKDLNLPFIQTLKNKFNHIVGYSGHELGIATTLATIPLGAKVIERHFTLDRTMTGPDHAISLEPTGLKKLVHDIRRIEEALSGNSKYVTSGEFINRRILGKSLVSTQNIKSGQKITREMITAKSPAKGISPQKLYDLAGRTAIRDIKKDEYFTEEDLGKSRAKRNFKSESRWGLIVRPHDFEQFIKANNPPVAEFHLSWQDLDQPLTFKHHPNMELVVHSPELLGDVLLDLCSNDKKTLNFSIKHANNLLDKVRGMKKYFSKKPEKTKVIIHPGGMSYKEFVSEKEKNRMYKTLTESLKKINTDGIDLLLENLPPFPWYKGGQWFSNIFMDADEIFEFCKKNKYNICYDTSHAQLYCNFAKKDPVEFLKAVKPLTKHIQISDAAGVDGEGLQIDEGNVPFKKLMPEILELNMSMTPEIWMGHRYDGEGFWIALSKLKKYGL